MEILLATYNRGKAREIAAILDPIQVKGMNDLGVNIDFDAVEDGETYEENALKKVGAAAEHYAGIIVADDSGLEVAALGGRPGIHSARYGGDGVSDSERYKKLLEEMQGVPEAERAAKFVCVIGVKLPDGDTTSLRGECAGTIAQSPLGDSGFGYDPVFLLPARGVTMAQITPEEKNGISHRAVAFRALKEFLLKL